MDLDYDLLSVEHSIPSSLLGMLWSTQSNASKLKIVVQDGPLAREKRDSFCHQFDL